MTFPFFSLEAQLWKGPRLENLNSVQSPRSHHSVGLAIIQGVCAMAVFLSSIGTALGFSSLIAATVAGPATGFHANRFRIPMLAIAGLGAVINLVLLWNAERMRRNPSARWRMRPLARKERLEKWIQLGTSVLTLLLIAGELLAHPLFHHEL